MMVKVLFIGLLILLAFMTFGCQQPVSVSTQFPTPKPSGAAAEFIEVKWSREWTGTQWHADCWGKIKALKDLSYIKVIATYEDSSQNIIGQRADELPAGLAAGATWEFDTQDFYSYIEPVQCTAEAEAIVK